MQTNVYLSSTFIMLEVFVHLVYIVYALIRAMFGITGLLKILHKETENLFRKNDNLN